MFENASIMVMKADDPSQILRLEVDGDTQQSIDQSFAEAVAGLSEDKNMVPFDGSYKPDEDELLFIDGFILPDEIKEAIRNPIGVTAYQKEGGSFPEIKAIFVGTCTRTNGSENFQIAFQRFRKEQYISTKGFNLYFSNNTFHRERNYGISVSDRVDCYYADGKLQFTSYFYAKQIFGLKEFFPSASDPEVEAFATNDLLFIENSERFRAMADTWVRRKIASINDTGVLNRYSASQIKKLAKKSGVNIEEQNGRVLLPSDKEQMKIVLGFLDEEVYKGPFSRDTLLANSKRKIKK